MTLAGPGGKAGEGEEEEEGGGGGVGGEGGGATHTFSAASLSSCSLEGWALCSSPTSLCRSAFARLWDKTVIHISRLAFEDLLCCLELVILRCQLSLHLSNLLTCTFTLCRSNWNMQRLKSTDSCV